MKKNYWKVVDEIIRQSDLVLNILDSRFYNETRNEVIEKKLRDYRKKFIFVLNKSDTVSKNDLKKAFKGLRNASAVIAISTRERHGKLKLLRTITYLIKKRPIIIGVVGYPNTGKSSVINYLAGRKKARTSPEAGFTKGKQWINLSRNIRLIDTPGVIPSKEKSKMELALKSAVTRVEDAEETAAEIIRIIIRKRKFNTLKKRYGIKESINPSIILEMIAKSKNKLKKKGELDLDGAAKMVIHDWQKGKLK